MMRQSWEMRMMMMVMTMKCGLSKNLEGDRNEVVECSLESRTRNLRPRETESFQIALISVAKVHTSSSLTVTGGCTPSCVLESAEAGGHVACWDKAVGQK